MDLTGSSLSDVSLGSPQLRRAGVSADPGAAPGAPAPNPVATPTTIISKAGKERSVSPYGVRQHNHIHTAVLHLKTLLDVTFWLIIYL